MTEVGYPPYSSSPHTHKNIGFGSLIWTNLNRAGDTLPSFFNPTPYTVMKITILRHVITFRSPITIKPSPKLKQDRRLDKLKDLYKDMSKDEQERLEKLLRGDMD